MSDWLSAVSAEQCTCSHPPDCGHDCHGHLCDPGEEVCSIEFLPDEGGVTLWGCADCTPGEGAWHLPGCAATLSTAAMAGRVDQDASSQP